MYHDEKIASTPGEIVELFADHFEKNYDADDQRWNFHDVYVHPKAGKEINVTLFDIESAIHSLDWKDGMGPDSLHPIVIKMCVKEMTWPIWLLFQKTFESKKVPDCLKLARVVPVFKKKGKRNDGRRQL